MSASDDFKATVNASLSRGGVARLPRRGEVVLFGQRRDGELVRVRIPRYLQWFDSLIARSLVRNRAVERLAVILPGGESEGSSRSLRIGLADKNDTEEPATGNPRIAKLLAAARSEWTGVRPPLLLVAGRPWPITVLVVALLLDLFLGAERLAWTLAGFYQWIPVVPAVPSGLLHVAYLALVAVTIQQLWRQARAGYVLGIVLAAVQVVRTVALAGLEYRSLTVGQFVLWMAEALLFPAMIALLFLILYQAGIGFNASAGGRGARGEK